MQNLSLLEYAELELRRERDRLLNESDWIVTRSVEQGVPIPTAWAEYRQTLRDLPANSNIQLNKYEHLDWTLINIPNKPE